MNNRNKKFTEKDPVIITTIAVLYSFISMYITNMGRSDDGPMRGNTLFTPSFFIIALMLVPFINKECRIYWNKKNIIIMILGLLITIPIYIVCSINRYNTFGYWY